MSKIEEMAIQFANEMYCEYTTQYMVEQGWPKARAFFMQGANTVLSEIEKAYNTYKDAGATCAIINKTIKELKGE